MKTELYVQIVPVRSHWNPDKVTDVRVGKVTKTRPDAPEAGAVLTKVVLEVPAEHFLTQTVEVEASVPAPIRAVS